MTTATTSELIIELETFLDSSDRHQSTQQDIKPLSDIAVTLEDALGEINAVIHQHTTMLTAPLTGDAQERFERLRAANIEVYEAWHDLGAIIDTMQHYRHLWRQRGEGMTEMIKSYVTVFGFPLPPELRPDEQSTDDMSPTPF
jgi:hypothetical protein